MNNDRLDKCARAAETLITDVNNLVKQAMTDDYVGFCSMVVLIVQKLARLKDEIKNLKETEGAEDDV